MVMNNLPLTITKIDVVGSICTLLAVIVAVYFGLIKSDSAAEELHELRSRQIDAQAEHSQLQKITQRNLAEYRSMREAAAREGKLDDQLRVDQRISAFRNMVARHGWEGLQIMPLEWRSAADVGERSFKVTATCKYHELLAFFREFEESKVWADISHLQILPVEIVELGQEQRCTVELTLNFYESYTPSDQST